MPGTKQKSPGKGHKKKVTDMDIDEFMAHGFDSDVSIGDENDDINSVGAQLSEKHEESNDNMSKSKTSKHKEQLSRLQSKDPEFYKFLQENDEELLEFADSETEDELQTDDSEDKADDRKQELETEKLSQDDQMVSDEEETYLDKEKVISQRKGKLITNAMIKSWNKGLKRNSLACLKQTVEAFSCIVQDALDQGGSQTGEQKPPKYRVEGSDVFNSLVQICLKNVLTVIQHHLGIDPANVPSKFSGKKWSQVKTTVKIYLKAILQVLRKLSDPTILCVVLRHTHSLCPFYAVFPKITRPFIKRMVRMWSSGEEHVRVMAFVGLTKLLRLTSSQLLDFSIKQLYTNFVKNCKFTSANTLPTIVFMQNSLVEVFSYDVSTTYQHGFVYIRQLAIHLRNALVQRKKESYLSVYNWQFIHCLGLWSRVLSEVQGIGVLEPLIYPLVQVTIGVIKLNPTSRYYPLRFHCIRSLNLLSQATDKFIPTAPLLLEILDSAEFRKETKHSTAKPVNFSCILKISKSHQHTKSFQDSVVENVTELLLEHFSTHAHSIGFPELAFPCVVKMKQFVKSSKIARFCKQMKQIVEKLEETSQEVTKRRSTVSFSPKDLEEVEKWTEEYRKQPNAIVKFYNRWKSMKMVIPPQEEAQIQEDSDEEKTMKSSNKKRKTKTKQEKEPKKIRREVEKKPVKKTKTLDEDVEDVVEDLHFSDLED